MEVAGEISLLTTIYKAQSVHALLIGCLAAMVTGCEGEKDTVEHTSYTDSTKVADPRLLEAFGENASTAEPTTEEEDALVDSRIFYDKLINKALQEHSNTALVENRPKLGEALKRIKSYVRNDTATPFRELYRYTYFSDGIRLAILLEGEDGASIFIDDYLELLFKGIWENMSLEERRMHWDSARMRQETSQVNFRRAFVDYPI